MQHSKFELRHHWSTLSHPLQNGKGSSTAVLQLALKEPAAAAVEMTAVEAVTEAAETVAVVGVAAAAAIAAPRSRQGGLAMRNEVPASSYAGGFELRWRLRATLTTNEGK